MVEGGRDHGDMGDGYAIKRVVTQFDLPFFRIPENDS